MPQFPYRRRYASNAVGEELHVVRDTSNGNRDRLPAKNQMVSKAYTVDRVTQALTQIGAAEVGDRLLFEIGVVVAQGIAERGFR